MVVKTLRQWDHQGSECRQKGSSSRAWKPLAPTDQGDEEGQGRWQLPAVVMAEGERTQDLCAEGVKAPVIGLNDPVKEGVGWRPGRWVCNSVWPYTWNVLHASPICLFSAKWPLWWSRLSVNSGQVSQLGVAHSLSRSPLGLHAPGETKPMSHGWQILGGGHFSQWVGVEGGLGSWRGAPLDT